MLDNDIKQNLSRDVELALAEDIGEGDITARLIPESAAANARVITREQAVICGHAWVNEVFRQVAPEAKLIWHVEEGEDVAANSLLFEVSGNARHLLTAERTALNFLQTLSGTATSARKYAEAIRHTDCKILDTRKTLPGLRLAQKYATRCGGCKNHRIGLWDAYLIKENHIAACGSIESAIQKARQLAPEIPVEVEVESIEQLMEATQYGADIVMLDNFSLNMMREAVALISGKVKLEASGGIDNTTLVSIAETGVDYISIGAMTKHCKAIDLSMRFV